MKNLPASAFLAARLVAAVGFVTATMTTVVAQSSTDIIGDPEVVVYRTVGADSLTVAIFPLLEQSRTNRPGAVLFFHGGAWERGTPTWEYQRARRYAAAGMRAIAVQYRLAVGEDTPIESIADVCAAVRWARANADRLAIDPFKVAAYGVSAGGHLVTAAASVGCPEEGSGVSGIPDALVLWSPALDVPHDEHFQQKLQDRATAAMYSPAETVHDGMPPTSIVQGEMDSLTRLPGTQRFCAQMLELERVCELHVFPDVGHTLGLDLEIQDRDYVRDPIMVEDAHSRQIHFLLYRGYDGTR